MPYQVKSIAPSGEGRVVQIEVARGDFEIRDLGFSNPFSYLT